MPIVVYILHVCARFYFCLHVFLYVCTYVGLSVCMHICTTVCMREYMYVCLHAKKEDREKRERERKQTHLN